MGFDMSTSNYEIINAIGKLTEEQAKWEEFKIASIRTNSLFTRYEKIKVNLKNKYTKATGAVDLDDYHRELIAYNGTFGEWLVSIGDKALNQSDKVFKLGRKGLLFREALSNHFKIVPVKTGLLPDDTFVAKNHYSDLFITKEGVDPIQLLKYTLVSVNGYYHMSDANSKGLWVTKGYDTMKKRKKHCIGFTSFENLGSLKQIPIRKDMVSRFKDEIPLKDEVIIDIGEDTSEKTIILVLGGYLHVLDYDVFYRVSDTAIKIKFNNIPYLERIHASIEDLDVEEIGLEETRGERNISLVNLYSDETITRYLTLPYSFIVLLDNEEVFKEITYPQQRSFANSYLSDTRPYLPMFTRLGKVEEYVWIKDEFKYEIVTDDSRYQNRQYNYAFPLDSQSYQSDGRQPNQRFERPYAYFMNLITPIDS